MVLWPHSNCTEQFLTAQAEEQERPAKARLEGGQPLLRHWGHSASGVKCQSEEGTALPLLQHPMEQTRAEADINRGSFAVAGSLFLQSSSAASASG